MMESAKYTIKVVLAIQELDFSEDACNINQYVKKIMQNNDISEIINIERKDILWRYGVYSVIWISEGALRVLSS